MDIPELFDINFINYFALGLAIVIALLGWIAKSLFNSVEMTPTQALTFMRRSLDFFTKKERAIMLVGPSGAGKSCFVTALNPLNTPDDCAMQGMTIGVGGGQAALMETGTKDAVIEYKIADIGGFELQWLRTGLDDNSSPAAILLFFSYENDEQKATENYIRGLVDVLSEAKYRKICERVRVVVPVVSKSDIWLNGLSTQQQMKVMNSIQQRYIDVYSEVIALFGPEVCHDNFKPCSARTRHGIGEIINLVSSYTN